MSAILVSMLVTLATSTAMSTEFSSGNSGGQHASGLSLLQLRAEQIPVDDAASDDTNLRENGGSATAEEWAALVEEARSIAAEMRAQNINPPLLMSAQGCVGSSAVLRTTKELMEDQNVAVYPAKGELYKKRNNPFWAKFGEAGSFVEAAKEATQAKQTLIFKIPPNWLGLPGTHDEAKEALLALQPKTTLMLRYNVVDQLVCLVRDCFDTDSGEAVSTDGTRNNACFKRRKTGEHTMAKINTNHMKETLEDKFDDRTIMPKRLFDSKFGKPLVVYYEDLMASEMDKSKLDLSTKIWQNYMSHLGIELNVDKVRAFLEKTAGTYPAPSSHKDVIYNFDEVEKSLKPYPYLYRFLRK